MTSRTITLGGRQLTRIGLGTNRLTDTAENRSFLEAAAAAEIGMVDTAYTYTGGESEATIGGALAARENGPVVATKGGYRGGGTDRLRTELEQSFERLRLDTIPLYYLHRVDPETPLTETLSVLAEYRDAGRLEHVGLSEVTVEQVEEGQTVVSIAAVQNHYSLSERKSDDVVDYCAEQGVIFVPYFPLRGVEADMLDEVAIRHGATPDQIKLAWLLERSPAILPIPGTLSLEHLEENLRALDIELSSDEFSALGDA